MKLFGHIAPHLAAVRADLVRVGDRLGAGVYQPFSLANVHRNGETVTEVEIDQGLVYIVGDGNSNAAWPLEPHEVVMIEKEK